MSLFLMGNEVILKKCSMVEISVIDLGSTPKSVLAFKRYILNRLFFRICASRTFRMSPQNARGLILHAHAAFTAQMQTCCVLYVRKKKWNSSYFLLHL